MGPTSIITVFRNRGYYISPPVMLRNTVTGCYITVTLVENNAFPNASLALTGVKFTSESSGLLVR
jgi:hypothetical protein